MKGNLKKLLSVTVAIAIVMTVCPLWGYATDVLKAENFLGDQVSTAVTSDFIVPTGYTWTTSNDALTINQETGEVTVNKLPFEDRFVTLTANGEKSFDLIVKSQTTKVEQYANYTNEESIWIPMKGSANNASIAVEDDGNYYLSLNYAGDAWSAYPMGVQLNEMTGNFTVSFDFKLDWLSEAPEGNTTVTASGYEKIAIDFMTAPNETGAAAQATADLKARALVIYKDEIAQIGKTAVTDIETFDNAKWSNVTFEVNPLTTQVRILLPDGEWSSWYDMLSSAEKTNYLGGKLTHVGTSRTYGKGYVGTLKVDNFSVSTQSVENMTSDEKIVYYNGIINLSDLTSETKGAITGNITLNTYDGAVVWESSNPDVIDNEGNVKQPERDILSAVKLSAKLAETDEVIKSFYLAVAPKNTTTNVAVDTTTKILTDDFEKGTAGTIITDAQSSYSAANKWGYVDAPTAEMSFAYAMDETRGKVAELDYSGTDKARVSYFVGGYVKAINHRYSAGFDFKYIPSEDASNIFRFEFAGAGALNCLVFDYAQDKLYCYRQGTTIADTYKISSFATEDGWVRVDVDNNNVSRTQQVYINGVALTQHPSPNTLYNTASDNFPMRSISFQLYGKGSVLIDNVAVVRHTDTDLTMADAAIEAVRMHYGYFDKQSYLQGETILPSNGPSDRNNPSDRSDTTVFPADVNGAKLTWAGKGVTENEGVYYFIPATPGAYELTVTATYNGKSLTEKINVIGQLVNITEKDGVVSASGKVTEGRLIIAKYADENMEKIEEVKLVEGTTYTVTESGTYKAFWINMSTLFPYALDVKFTK